MDESRQAFIVHVIVTDRQKSSVEQIDYEIDYNYCMKKRFSDWQAAIEWARKDERDRLAKLAESAGCFVDPECKGLTVNEIREGKLNET